MKRFSPRLLAIGFVVGALGTAAILAAGAYARTPHHNGTSRRTGKRVVRRSRHTSRPMATAPPSGTPRTGSSFWNSAPVVIGESPDALIREATP